MEIDEVSLPYFKINKLFWRWSKCEGAEGCHGVREAQLSMEKAPPELKRLPPPVERAAQPEKPDPAMKMLDDIERIAKPFVRFKAWLDAPVPPKTPKPEAPAAKKQEVVPPFDIQEIPGAMRKEFMPVSAKLMERWFAGELNYSRSDDDQKDEINQDGQRYSESMIDRTSITMDWVLKHERARRQYEELINTRIYNQAAYDEALKILLRYRKRLGVSPWGECGNDIRKLHKNFQFQLVAVESTFEQKAEQYLRRMVHDGVPDDLTGSLGAFNFYAAIAKASFDPQGKSATVTHIVIYVRDSYSFEGVSDTRSQYLGHWSKDGVIVVPGYVALNVVKSPWLDYPVVTGNISENLYKRGKVYYPVRNKSFREWQLKHRRGGDFIIYSDWKSIRLERPIKVYFE
ncbi:DUF6402 family protein [Trinickia mobilis]|uniref:DUF6402 family protein n=1 Tax=Trinickia mobilis TaxID=2816356 RepID=UPI001F5D2977|nr:DUF6402 family protein [Trinickia mobilis]